jgi:hypothetical protein
MMTIAAHISNYAFANQPAKSAFFDGMATLLADVGKGVAQMRKVLSRAERETINRMGSSKHN